MKRRRKARLILRRLGGRWWYLSYGHRTGWKGAVIVQAPDFAAAVWRAVDIHVAPDIDGLEVRGQPFTESAMDEIPEEARNRLLNKTELKLLFGELTLWK